MCENNTFTANCLAILDERDAMGANANELILNCRPIGEERPSYGD